MNVRMVFHILGRILQVESALLIFPALIALIYNENLVALSFVITATAAFLLGTVITISLKPKSRVIYAKEGFAIVSLAWITVSAVGALPFVISGEIPSFVDAFFETVSGFTTTGSSILVDVEAMSHGCLFWRSFTHWIGGMGFLVFVMAIIPNVSERSMHILKAEVPGPVVGKLVPRIKDTSKILYLIYAFMTVVQIILLVLGDMPLFDSALHAFGTAGTGGFSIKADGLASYSPYCQWVITIFMALFGVNFNIYYFLLIKRFTSVFKSGELWCYLSVIGTAVTLICINTFSLYERFSDCLRHTSFTVSSIITTTGYATVNFDKWPDFSKTVLLILMMFGGCAGSTAGGIKISRVVLLFKTVVREVKKLIHPRSVSVIKFEGRTVEEKTVNSVSVYLAIYMICMLAVFLIVSIEPFGIETNFSAAVTCFNNVGPGLAAVGPTANFSCYSDFSTVVLSFAMLLGRLEIFPLIIALSPSTWTKSKIR